MSGPSRSFPQPFESSVNQDRGPNAGNPAYSAEGHAPSQQTPNPGGYSSQPPASAPSTPTSYPSAASGFPSLPTGYSYSSRSGPPPTTVQGNASMSIPGHSYTTQPASYPDYVPAPNTSYPPPQSHMTEGVQTNHRGWGYQDARDSSDEYFEQDAEATSNLSGYVPKGPPRNPSAGRPSPSRSQYSAPQPDLLPCRLCRRFFRRQDVERLGGYCSESHRWQAQVQAQTQGRY